MIDNTMLNTTVTVTKDSHKYVVGIILFCAGEGEGIVISTCIRALLSAHVSRANKYRIVSGSRVTVHKLCLSLVINKPLYIHTRADY